MKLRSYDDASGGLTALEIKFLIPLFTRLFCSRGCLLYHFILRLSYNIIALINFGFEKFKLISLHALTINLNQSLCMP